MTYLPQPINTSLVTLSSDILLLTEKLAEHAHEVWAAQRIKDGWSLGESRDDVAKKHPCLVSYPQLSDAEKQYDRNAALETLKVIQALGYRIVSPDRITDECERVLALLDLTQPSAAQLLPLWQERKSDMPVWKQPQTYARLAKHLIGCGLNYTAQEVSLIGMPLATGEMALKLRHLKGLALARCGFLDAAAKELNDAALVDLPRDEEMLGLEAAVEKQLGFNARSPEGRLRHLQQARALYNTAWNSTDGSYWTGINVASLNLLLGERELAASVAKQVEVECLRENDLKHDTSKDDPYWRWATLGEAYLNQGQLKRAEEWYRRAGSDEVARNRSGFLNSTRRQLKFLLQATGEDVSLIDEWLPMPGVAIFTGHRIDPEDCLTARFPRSLETRVKEAISKWLIDNRIRTGVSSAANGADILFLEALQSLEGSDTRIVLPFAEAEFIKQSVMNETDTSWLPRFEAVMKKASRKHIASSDRIGGGTSAFEFANRLILGQGLMLAAELQTSLSGLSVWDGEVGTGVGGTADSVDRWRQQNLTIYTIDLKYPPSTSTLPLTIRCEGSECAVDAVKSSQLLTSTNDDSTPVMAMLFADAKGFSGLSDREVVKFLDYFLKRVAMCVEKHAKAVVLSPELWCQTSIPVRETWGDGLYFAIKDVRTAGLFALDLCDAVSTTNWRQDVGLAREMQIRIALHCGPVHLGQDPVTGLPKCTGTHVSRAARLEPSTPPNHVYASDAFAALAAEERVSDFTCEFAKLLDWAKDHGTYPTYVVRRK